MSTLYVNTISPNSGDTVSVSGSLFVSGTINLGDENTDSVSFGAEISSSIIPDAANTYDLGSISKPWRKFHGTASAASHSLTATTATTASLAFRSVTASYVGPTGIMTGSLHGSSSYAISASHAAQAVSASTSTSASYIHANNIAGTILSSSYTLSSSFASTAAVSQVATTVTITDNESTDENNALIFTAGGDLDGGNLGLESDGTLFYNPSTGYVTATGFSGTLNGTSSVALTSVSSSIATRAITADNLGIDLTPTLETKTAGFTAAAGREYIVNDADGAAIVLPSAVAGARITIIIGTLITSNTTTITAAGGDLLKGYAILEATDAANNKTMFVPDGSDDLIITLNGSTKGGLVGDRIELVGISATEWRVRATLSHTGTAATPFS